jgi:hypothetical protein
MKATGLIFLLTALFFLTACGRNNTNPNENTPNENGPVIPDTNGVQGFPSPVIPVETPAFVSPLETVRLVPAVRSGLSGTPITWGFNPTLYGNRTLEINMADLYRRAEQWAHNERIRLGGIHVEPDINQVLSPFSIQRILGEYFNVALTGVYVTDEMIISGSVPDIFFANPHLARATGLARTISEDMIRRYAPNYAAFLDSHNGWEVSRTESGEQFALNTFDEHHPYTNMFSIYRLEWIERFDFPFPGGSPVIKIADNVYFTPEMYTPSEFLDLIHLFSFEEPNPHNRPRGFPTQNRQITQAANQTWSMVYDSFDDPFFSIAPILGMFGINTSIMEDNGVAVPFFASQTYREALEYLGHFDAFNNLFFTGGSNSLTSLEAFVNQYIRIGWIAVETEDVYWVVNESLRRDPDRKFLITPAIGSSLSESPFNPSGEAWVIANGVSDDTLSRILNMFDAMAFDPEVFSLVTYGFHEESRFYNAGLSKDFFITTEHIAGIPTGFLFGKSRFEWESEPFNSQISFRRDIYFDLLEGVFFTGIVTESVWPRRFMGIFEEIDRFARSAEGMKLNLLPHRADTNNEFAIQRASLDALYWPDLMTGITHEHGFYTRLGYVELHLRETLHGHRIAENGRPIPNLTWDEYIQELNKFGLQEYIDLFSQFPQR